MAAPGSPAPSGPLRGLSSPPIFNLPFATQATTATQMSAALTEALDSGTRTRSERTPPPLPIHPYTPTPRSRPAQGARTLGVNIEVPELLPSSRGYDVDAHALLALAAVQAVCRDAAATATVLTHTLDCALRTQVYALPQ